MKIRNIIKLFIIGTFGVIGCICIALLITFLVFFRNVPSCSGDSEAAIYARSLSQLRLSKLYYYSNENMQFPKEFRDLKVVRISPSDAQIMVAGCFDNYMYLEFEGIDNNKPSEIVLRYGDMKVVKEKLWPNQ